MSHMGFAAFTKLEAQQVSCGSVGGISCLAGATVTFVNKPDLKGLPEKCSSLSHSSTEEDVHICDGIGSTCNPPSSPSASHVNLQAHPAPNERLQLHHSWCFPSLHMESGSQEIYQY